jgi:hypothetical protein
VEWKTLDRNLEGTLDGGDNHRFRFQGDFDAKSWQLKQLTVLEASQR